MIYAYVVAIRRPTSNARLPPDRINCSNRLEAELDAVVQGADLGQLDATHELVMNEPGHWLSIKVVSVSAGNTCQVITHLREYFADVQDIIECACLSDLQNRERFLDALRRDADLMFILSDDGHLDSIAPVAKAGLESNALTLCIVTSRLEQPFSLIHALAELGVDLVIVPSDTQDTQQVAFNAVKAISQVLLEPTFDVDFADVASVIKQGGLGRVGCGVAADTAEAQALALQGICRDATGWLIVYAKGNRPSIGVLDDLEEITRSIRADAILWAEAIMDARLGDEVEVIAIATGIGANELFQNNRTKGAYGNFRTRCTKP